MPGGIKFKDNPGGINAYGWGWQVKFFSQDFEVHVMCLAGEEFKAVYGGFLWGHSFTHENNGYSYFSYAQRSDVPNTNFSTSSR